jgi:hypothetical protein
MVNIIRILCSDCVTEKCPRRLVALPYRSEAEMLLKSANFNVKSFQFEHNVKDEHIII